LAKTHAKFLIYSYIVAQQYWDEQEAYRDQLIRNSGYDPSHKAQYIIDLKRDLGQHLFETHGGVWTLSEAVGVISIFSTPCLIGALLYFVNGRIVKNMRNKRVFFQGTLFDFNIWPKDNNDTIYQTLQSSLKDSIAAAKILRGRVIDFGPLDSLGPHIDWVGLLGSASFEPQT
jgi:hypothetical protein